MNEETRNAPIKTLRDGAVVVKIWEQHGKNGPYTSATIGRTYKNEQTGEFGESRSLSGSDVLKVQALLGEANKEMILWREYHKEIARQQQPNQPPADNAATQVALPTEAQSAQGLAPQRDAALSNAQPSAPVQSPDHGPNRGPEQ